MTLTSHYDKQTHTHTHAHTDIDIERDTPSKAFFSRSQSWSGEGTTSGTLSVPMNPFLCKSDSVN
jgi:hypothetical protein